MRCHKGAWMPLVLAALCLQEVYGQYRQQTCGAGDYQCSRSNRCIEASRRCDEVADCPDADDEQGCACDPNDFQCIGDGACIENRKRCDGIANCRDGSDELNCDPVQCPVGTIKCESGAVKCGTRCNQIEECENLEDEEGCAGECPRECDGQCLSESQICDGNMDCSDQSDEIGCEYCNGYDDFRCLDNSDCLKTSLRCNNIAECDDGSDEKDCNDTMIPSHEGCSDNEFKCSNGICINKLFYCDGNIDCSDQSDEINCSCREDQFQCSSRECIPYYNKCDGHADCRDQSDELGCPGNDNDVSRFTTEYPYRTTTSRRFPDFTTTARWNDQYRPNAPSGLRPDNRYDPYGQGASRPGPNPSDNGNRPDQYGGSTTPGGGYGQEGQSGYPGSNGEPYNGGSYPNGPSGGSGQEGQSGYPGSNGEPYNGGRNPNGPSGGSGQEGQSGYPGSNGDPYNGDRYATTPGGGYGQEGQSGYPGSNGEPDNGGRYPNGPGGSYGQEGQSGYPDSNGGSYNGDRYPNGPSGGSGQGGQSGYPGSSGDSNGVIYTTIAPGGGYGQEGQPGYPDSNGGSYNGGRYPNGPSGGSGQGQSGYPGSNGGGRPQSGSQSGGSVRGPITLNIRTYPDQQSIRFGGDVVFQCRDEGPLRAPVRWVREGGRSMKPGFSDRNGRLELYQVTTADSGVYICQAPRYLGQPKSEMRVTLTVEQDDSPPVRFGFTPCKSYEATCSDGGCIPKDAVCNGKVDCADRSDEERCPLSGRCEPNQFQCDNRKCVLKTWRCDSEDDCGDGSDEICEQLPGQACRATEFACHSQGQCVPRSFHCDGHKDCFDNSDELGCADAYVVQPPTPANVQLKAGETLVLRAEARGIPTPFISWRLNWGHVPPQCTSTSENGTGILTCPDMQPEYNGAYSAEALNHKATVFARPDAIVVVTKTSPCPPATFNIDARSERECISCFCFGKTTQCHSAELFTYDMPTPLGEGGSRMVGVTITPYGEVRTGGSIANHYFYQPMRNAFAVTKLAYEDTSLGRFHPYVTLPELYQGQQLTSYGGHIKFKLIPHSRAFDFDDSAPTIIIKGKYETLFYFHRVRGVSNETLIDVRLTPENWQKPRPNGLEPAARQDLMMALDDITAIYLRADLNNAGVNISNFVMESANHIDVGLGAANLVEDCRCPPGYEGLSCQKCAAGYTRKENSDPWSSDCVRETCPPGTYGDPATGLPCKTCPCPLTNRENQFARTCSLARDGSVNCDCFPGYEGQDCGSCAPGYEGNPLVKGDSCRIKTMERCNSVGTEAARRLDECVCKENVQGRYCDQCKPNSYYLSNDFRGGCALCFCTGIHTNCTSGNLRRKTTFLNFNVPNIVEQVRVYNSSVPIGTGAFSFGAPIETDLKPVLGTSGLTIRGLDNRRQTVYYWSLPSNFAGDKVTSYGGFLRYTLENVPSFLNVRSRSLTAADVQLISDNHITIQYNDAFKPTPEGVLNATVQFLESKWHISDGSEVSRAMFLLALADVKAILIKATYGDSIATPLFASIDTAESHGTGPVALHVEECDCPVGHKGYSCEDCAPGYTRGGDGIYLEICVPCNCNKHSTECHPETGVCYGCKDNTDGPQCEVCKEGYRRDEYNNCVEIEGTTCRCDPRGTEGPCDASGRCYCKANVEGRYCDRCRAGTFGLESRNPTGCIECFCSDTTQQCQEAHHYTRIAMAALIFGDNYGGYALTDLNAETVISDQFVPVPDKSELVYVFPYPPSEELYWSLPVFPGNRVLSYGGMISLRQEFKSNTYELSEPGTDVVLIGDSISVFWTNPHQLRSQQSMSYQVPLMEHGWYRLGTAVPASRKDFMRVLKNLRRVLVRATIAQDLVSTTIADVSMDTATDSIQTDAQAALGVELCSCPPGHLGTSCESCAAGYYKDAQDYCVQCPCNGHDCQLHANGEVTCNCRPPYTGYDCSAIVGESQGTTHRPVAPESTVTVRISGDKRIIIQEVGTSVNFTCQAMSRINSNRLRVSWSKKDGYLPRNRAFVDENSGVLKIVNVQITDSGIYVCQAYDGVGSNQAAITLRVPANVMTVPMVSIEPAVEEYYEGDRVELICKVQGTPMPTISWQRASRKPLPLNSQQIDDLFIIESIRQEDSGEYSCTATNSAGSGTNIAVVNVRPRPSSPQRDQLIVSPQAPVVDEGQSTRVVCTGSTNVPAGTIDWVRQDNTRFQGNVHSDNGVLFIDVATLDNAGVYLCQTHGADVPPVVVLVTVTPLTTPSPSESSKITVSVKSIKIPEGESGFVDCTPSGVELPQIRWSRYQGEFGPGTSQRGDTLIINNAHESDKGYYVCEGRVRGALIETSYVFVDIDKREAPRVQILPTGVQPVALGTVFEFHCRVLGGIPEPVITWSRSGGRELSSTTSIKPKNILRFDPVDVNDDGEYICTASNIVSSVTDTAVIRVRAYPTIQITPSNYVQVTQGEPITVDCRADGRPDPMVSIRGPNLREVVSPSLRIASLRITAARDSDDGNYACVATSEAGSTESPFIIVVDRGDGGDDGGGSGETNIDPGFDSNNYYPVNPDFNQFPDERPHDLVVNDGSSQAIAECHVTPGEYGPRWERSDRQPLQKNAVQEGNRLIISDVSSSDSGEYICSVYSSETGDARVAQYIRLLVVRAPVITLVPLTQTVRPGDSPTVECQVDGEDIIDTHWSIANASGRVEVRGTTLIFNNIQVEDAGQYECFARNPYVNASNKASVHVAAPAEQVQLVRIEQPFQRYNIGDNVQVNCRALSLDASVNWEKFGTRQYIDSRRYGGGAMLSVPKVTIGDAGVYRCTGVDPRGRTSYEDFNLEVEPGSLNTVYPRERNVPVTKHRARLHETVVMPCSHNLEEPININWKRLYSQLPSDVRTDQPQLVLTNVNEGDAGTYVCRVSNNRIVVETRAILRVTGVVPSFNGDSWIALMPIKDAYRQFDIEVSFKPADSNGIILYNSERPDRSGKYIALHMKNGVPEFVMDTGYGPVYVQGDRPLQLQVWHTIRVNWIQSRVTMDVDNGGQSTNETSGNNLLDLKENLYVGGVRDFNSLPTPLAGSPGFIGCVGMLILGHEEKNLMIDSVDQNNVQECDTCSPNLCRNDGVCQEARNERGYRCICAKGFAGLDCDRRGEACHPELCGPGKCQDTADGYKCSCPVTHTGTHCENTQSIAYPAFTGSAYIALKPPDSYRFLKMSMKIKAESPVQDGIIMYCAESSRGLGGFTSLAVRNKRLEFRYDLNEGNPVVLVSNTTLPADDWTDVQITRAGAVVSLNINLKYNYEQRLDSANKSLKLETPMFVGGVDENIILNNNTGVTGGFNGCIKDVKTQGNSVNIVSSSIQSANVKECLPRGDIQENLLCSCSNGGTCLPDGSCECPPEYTGFYCETRVARRRPSNPCVPQPCQNGGTCRVEYYNLMNHTCDCPLGYAGASCQIKLHLSQNVGFNGNGYLELPASLMNYESTRDPVMLALGFHTTQPGVLLFQSQISGNYRNDYNGDYNGDYIMIKVGPRGYVIVEWDKGSGVTSLTIDSPESFVTDGEFHKVVVRFLSENQVELTVDDKSVTGITNGIADIFNADTNIYIGGLPEGLYRRYDVQGLNGCIDQAEFMGMSPVNFGDTAVTARNTQLCKDRGRNSRSTYFRTPMTKG